MEATTAERCYIDEEAPDPSSCYLRKFKLYETRSNFYMIGRYNNKKLWRVLKINRLDPSELSIHEDASTYSEFEVQELIERIHEGNRSTGGLTLVTACYGIVGFIKFLEPYYMVVITERRKIGSICGHTIYAVAKTEMIPVHHSSVLSNLTYSKNEKRYKKLLSIVDLTKDFFFSYSYNVMHSLQKNLCNNGTGPLLYETMFVWNEFLTRGIRNTLKNTLWTVALVYGFFKQEKYTVSGKNFKLTLIARRSRHYAGTRYLKRGVNEKGRVANDVETEQIVFEDVPDGSPYQLSSTVQIRGSIPLFWSQETSRLNIKPDIILSKKDQNYEATKLHFENLVKRYGNPIILLNLIRAREKKPRETILRAEFEKAVRFVNKNLTKENRIRLFNLDLQKYSRKATHALTLLSRLGLIALGATGVFYCRVRPGKRKTEDDYPPHNLSYENECGESADIESSNGSREASVNPCVKVLKLQNGVLRTNCIDCLDRTNIAQYAYGLVALGYQLQILGLIKTAYIGLDDPLAVDLMDIYETMGDTLSLQYGGSAAHNKIFSERRGQWKAATQSQEFFRTLQRYYSNAYFDAEKQNAINVFLGHFQPQQGKPALWELDSDQHYNIGCPDSNFVDEYSRLFIKRSLSDGNIVCEDNSSLAAIKAGHNGLFCEREQGGDKRLSESTLEISTCGIDMPFSRHTPFMSCRKLFRYIEEDQCFEVDKFLDTDNEDKYDFTSFRDFDWFSSSGHSWEEDISERSVANQSSTSLEETDRTGTQGSRNVEMDKYDESFVRWVANGGMFYWS
ncbi:phosphoinositide phosphatase SAC2-like isoform X2 [Mangifera indica]|uniref:phosphoinositide phosphatase SAC2-like isoform X2 n=1 Tax=Mangifera indica TaxID=29780 RepID=UPI001CFB921E|nr:phosphoinositide phosphatase SAC2-like isoform X2 [Mangifera indica]